LKIIYVRYFIRYFVRYYVRITTKQVGAETGLEEQAGFSSTQALWGMVYMFKILFYQTLIIITCFFWFECSNNKLSTKEDFQQWFDSLIAVSEMDATFPNIWETELYNFENIQYFDNEFNILPDTSLDLKLSVNESQLFLKLNDSWADYDFSKSNDLIHTIDSLIELLIASKNLPSQIGKNNVPNVLKRVRLAIAPEQTFGNLETIIRSLTNHNLTNFYFVTKTNKENPWPHIPDQKFANYIKKEATKFSTSSERAVSLSSIGAKELNKCREVAHVWSFMDQIPSQDKLLFLSKNIPEALIKCSNSNYKKILTYIYAISHYEDDYVCWKNKINPEGVKISFSKSDKWKDIALRLFNVKNQSIWLGLH
jgi:hypothetical protein